MISYNAAPLYHLYPEVEVPSMPIDPSEMTRQMLEILGPQKMKQPRTFPVHRTPKPRDDILIWRDKFNATYLPTAPALWDEQSLFDYRRGIYPHKDVLLEYVGAVLSLGLDHAALSVSTDAYDDLRRVLTDKRLHERRPRFAQIILVQDLWLPTPFDLLVRAEDWCGKPRDIGSSLVVLEELHDIRREMIGISPALEAIPTDGSFRAETVLEYAWEGSTAMLEVCDQAIAHNLPLYIEGR